MKTLSVLIKLYKKPNERSYLLKFLTPMIVVNYFSHNDVSHCRYLLN